MAKPFLSTRSDDAVAWAKVSVKGAFCSLRAAGFLYDRGLYREDQGLVDLKAFLESRLKGLRPVLWGPQLVQEQLQEATHCGLFSMENNAGY